MATIISFLCILAAFLVVSYTALYWLKRISDILYWPHELTNFVHFWWCLKENLEPTILLHYLFILWFVLFWSNSVILSHLTEIIFIYNIFAPCDFFLGKLISSSFKFFPYFLESWCYYGSLWLLLGSATRVCWWGLRELKIIP